MIREVNSLFSDFRTVMAEGGPNDWEEEVARNGDPDPDRNEESATPPDTDTEEEMKTLKGKKKQDLLDQLTKVMQQNRVLNDTVAKLNKKISNLQMEKNSLLDDLTSTSSQLDDQRKITQDLLDQIDVDEPEDKKKIMLLMDTNRTVVRSHLQNTKYDWTVCTLIDTIDDITALLGDNGILTEIKKHDKVILSAGRMDIIETGLTGRATATKLLSVAEQIVRLCSIEVTILAVPPTRNKPGQVMVCNARLSKSNIARGISFISLSSLHEMDKDKSLADEATLSPEGAKVLVAQVMKELVIGKIVCPPAADAADAAATTSNGNQSKMRGITDFAPDQNDKKPTKKRNDDSSDEEIEETVHLKDDYVGKVIGSGGKRIKSIQSLTDTRIDIEKYKNEDGEITNWAFITGKAANVNQAKEEIKRIMQGKSRAPPVGSSPKTKKVKKSGK